MARGIRRMFAIALSQYRRALDERSVLDFSDVLQRALDLLRQMDEFAQSRYRLESRYHHVLVDEFQDTSRAQWELVSLLVESWGEGLGLADPALGLHRRRPQAVDLPLPRRRGGGPAGGGPLHRGAAAGGRARVDRLRAASARCRSCWSSSTTRSPRCRSADARADAVHLPRQRPVSGQPVERRVPRPGAGHRGGRRSGCLRRRGRRRRSRASCARKRCAIARTGVPRPAVPGDIAILFRSRASHREFEHELELLGIPTYVYKGLGFFDADETKDVVALVRYLARPVSDLRAAAFLRSRFVGCRTPALALLAPRLAAALTETPAAGDPAAARRRGSSRAPARPRACAGLAASGSIGCRPPTCWRHLLRETAYAYELRGPRRAAGVGKPEEDARHDPPDPEPRLRDAAADRRAHRRADRGRRVERGASRRSTPST